jgi:hypothetical protein
LDRGEAWENVERLLVLARRAHRAELAPARKDRIREELLRRWERERDRRLMARAFLAGATTVLLVGVLLRLVTGAAVGTILANRARTLTEIFASPPIGGEPDEPKARRERGPAATTDPSP